jgi:hypothetical protein
MRPILESPAARCLSPHPPGRPTRPQAASQIGQGVPWLLDVVVVCWSRRMKTQRRKLMSSEAR